MKNFKILKKNQMLQDIPAGSLWQTTAWVSAIGGMRLSREDTYNEYSTDISKGAVFTVIENQGTWVKIIQGGNILLVHRSWWPDVLTPGKLKRIK